MFDVMSYVIGIPNGKKNIAVTSDMTFTDDGEGNITISATSEEEGD